MRCDVERSSEEIEVAVQEIRSGNPLDFSLPALYFRMFG